MKNRIDKYQAIYEASPDPIILLDEHGFIDCNPATLKMFACSTAEEFINRHPGEYSPPTQADGTDSRVAADEKIAIAYKNGTNLFEWIHKRANGELFHAEVQLILLRLVDGDILQATVRDITERKNVMEANAFHIYRLESMQRINDAAGASPSPDDSLKNVIDEMRNIFQSDRAWLLYPVDPEATHFEVPIESNLPEYPGAFALNEKVPVDTTTINVFRNALASESPLAFPSMPKGDVRDKFTVLSQLIMAIKPQHGKPWMLGLHQCSGERQWTEKECELFQFIGSRMADMLGAAFLYQDLRKVSSAVEQAAESILITDTNGIIEYVNPAYTKITGYSQEQAIGKPLPFLKADAMDSSDSKNLWESVTNGSTWYGTLEDKKKNGKSYPAMMSVAPVYDDARKITHYVVTQQDMTSEVELKKQLFQSQKMESIGQLTGGIAHDFNNILAAIIGFTQLSIRHHATDPESKLSQYLYQVSHAAERGRDLVAKMLAFGRASPGELQAVDGTLLIYDVRKLLGSTLPSSLIFNVYADDKVPPLLANPGQLHQVITNLVINAHHAVGEHGKIELELHGLQQQEGICKSCHQRFSGKFIEISVRDDGHGISKDQVNQIFEPFFTTKDVGKGSGMGLPMVDGIVHQCNGHILVESNQGVGSNFRLLFQPASTENFDTASNKPILSVSVIENKSIMIVDDETGITEFLTELLSNSGYHVRAFNDPLAALKAFKADTRSIDLVITDQTMPNLTGAKLAQELLSLRADLPVILCTGYSQSIDETGAQQLGIAAFLKKPVATDTLLETIITLLTQSIDLQ